MHPRYELQMASVLVLTLSTAACTRTEYVLTTPTGPFLHLEPTSKRRSGGGSPPSQTRLDGRATANLGTAPATHAARRPPTQPLSPQRTSHQGNLRYSIARVSPSVAVGPGCPCRLRLGCHGAVVPLSSAGRGALWQPVISNTSVGFSSNRFLTRSESRIRGAGEGRLAARCVPY